MAENKAGLIITDLNVKDLRFPTSLGGHGSDSLHTDPDYSCAYVTLTTENGTRGYGLTFTLGRGTEVVVLAIKAMKKLVVGKNARDIFEEFGVFWRTLTSESQLRWIGPEKGVTHLAVAAIINALWDMWGRLEGKPVWRLLTDMTPQQLVSTIDFRYISDVLTKEEAVAILEKAQTGREARIANLMKNGYPAYTTQVGWLGYSDDTLKQLTKKYLELGFDSFKIKVGRNFDDDYRRCKVIREAIGDQNNLMVDANQAWDVDEAIEWMQKLSQFQPLWIEEPTSPDDVLGHATIAKALKPLGIGVASGEMCANRVMFKQFLQAGALQFCQVDAARIGGVNEILAVYLMAHKLNVGVCPHAGGVGLCEMVQHLQMWGSNCLPSAHHKQYIEYVDQQHEHFVEPALVHRAHYMPPKLPGYSTEMKPESIEMFEYPNGSEWQRMFSEGIFPRPEQ